MGLGRVIPTKLLQPLLCRSLLMMCCYCQKVSVLSPQ
nr:MAG TPA: hypothetical protein [Caudoviricetes sp.]DAS14921.1 MAG TPA: hypothetical protein [Caudoviricetes sp.]